MATVVGTILVMIYVLFALSVSIVSFLFYYTSLCGATTIIAPVVLKVLSTYSSTIHAVYLLGVVNKISF